MSLLRRSKDHVWFFFTPHFAYFLILYISQSPANLKLYAKLHFVRRFWKLIEAHEIVRAHTRDRLLSIHVAKKRAWQNIVMATLVRKHKKPLRALTGKRCYPSLSVLYFYFHARATFLLQYKFFALHWTPVMTHWCIDIHWYCDINNDRYSTTKIDCVVWNRDKKCKLAKYYNQSWEKKTRCNFY